MAEDCQGWVEEDLKLIGDDSKWCPNGKAHKQTKGGDTCYVYKAPGDPIWWIKVVGKVHGASIENVSDLLDQSLHERQSQWHHLFVVSFQCTSSPLLLKISFIM